MQWVEAVSSQGANSCNKLPLEVKQAVSPWHFSRWDGEYFTPVHPSQPDSIFPFTLVPYVQFLTNLFSFTVMLGLTPVPCKSVLLTDRATNLNY